MCDFITNPLWVVRTRLQSQSMHRLAERGGGGVRYRGMWDTACTIVRAEGVPALYKGLVASWLGATHVAVQFPLYEYLKRRWVDGEAEAAGGRAAVGLDVGLHHWWDAVGDGARAKHPRPALGAGWGRPGQQRSQEHLPGSGAWMSELRDGLGHQGVSVGLQVDVANAAVFPS